MDQIKTAAILVGGLSQRMGYDKKKLRIGGENILRQIVNQVLKDFDDIIIVGCRQEDIPDITGIRGTYPDVLDLSASLVGVYSALTHSESRYLYVTACDMPVYNSHYVQYMKKIIENKSDVLGCVTRYQEWIEPFNAFYSVDLIPKIKVFLDSGRKSIYKCFEKENLYFINEAVGRRYSPGWEMFCNLNTPRELKKHVKRMRDV